MDVFYNEFSTPQFFIKYNPQLPDLLSLAEVDGELHPLVYMIINTQMKTLLHSSGQKNLRYDIFKRTSCMYIGMGIISDTIF